MNPKIACDPALEGDPTIARIREALSAPGPFVFRDNLPLFREIFSSGIALRALRIALKRAVDDPDYQLPQFVMEGLIKGWTFLATEHFSISLGVRGSGPADADDVPLEDIPDAQLPRIQPYPFDLFLGFLATGHLAMDRYRIVAPADEQGEYRLQHEGRLEVGSGDSMLLRAGEDVSVSRLRGSLVYMEITGNPQVAVLPQFDPKTLAFCGWISGDPVASRLELLTRTLVEFEHRGALEEMLAISRHRDHYVRWNTIRHLLRLDPDAGIVRLEEARRDDHPEVREAAELTLARLAELEA